MSIPGTSVRQMLVWECVHVYKLYDFRIIQSSCRAHIFYGLLQTQFSFSQFCHWLLHLLLSWHVTVDTAISALVFIFFSCQVVLSPESSDLFLISSLQASKPSRPKSAFLHLYCTFSLSLMLSYLTWSLVVWPHAHLTSSSLLYIQSLSDVVIPHMVSCCVATCPSNIFISIVPSVSLWCCHTSHGLLVCGHMPI